VKKELVIGSINRDTKTRRKLRFWQLGRNSSTFPVQLRRCTMARLHLGKVTAFSVSLSYIPLLFHDDRLDRKMVKEGSAIVRVCNCIFLFVLEYRHRDCNTSSIPDDHTETVIDLILGVEMIDPFHRLYTIPRASHTTMIPNQKNITFYNTCNNTHLVILPMQ
jgi:hypothetical protein